MGSALPVLSGREVVRTFTKFGWQVARQSSSHIIMVKQGEVVTLDEVTPIFLSPRLLAVNFVKFCKELNNFTRIYR